MSEPSANSTGRKLRVCAIPKVENGPDLRVIFTG